MNRITKLGVGALALSLNCGLAATSGTPTGPGGKDSLGLDEVVVTATRVPVVAVDTPSLVTVLRSERIQLEMQARTLPEALREIPGVFIQKTSHGQGSPFIRGFTGFRNVMLIDGIRLNNSAFREGANQYWNTVDLNSADRIEVIKGPGSVLYGSDAIGGVVNTISSLRPIADQGLTGRALYRYSDAEDSRTARAQIGYGGSRVRVMLGATDRDYGDLEVAGLGVLPRTGYQEQDANARLEFDLSDRTSVALSHQQVNADDAWRTHRTIYSRSWKGTAVGTDRELILDQERGLSYLQLQHDGLGAVGDHLALTLSYQRQSEDQRRIQSNLRPDVQGFDVNTMGLGLQVDKQSRIGHWVYGFEYYRDDVESYRTDFNANGTVRAVRIQGPVADDAIYELAGLYVQDQIELTPRLDLTLGARYTYAAADARRVESPTTGQTISLRDHWDNIVGSARFSFKTSSTSPVTWFGGLSQGFRAPNLSDLTRLDIARSGELETPVLDLNPEQFVSAEIGAKIQSGRWSAQIAAYNTDVSDMIVRVRTGRIIGGNAEVTKKNAGQGYVRGLEAQVAAQLTPQWQARFAAFWNDGEVDQFPTSPLVSVREPLDLLMPATAAAALRWDSPARRWMIEGVATLSDRADKLSTRDILDVQRVPPGGTPGFTVFSLRGRCALTSQLDLALAVDNLTDHEYRIHGSGLNEPGRNVVVSLNWAP